jgi:hypothetical protein
MDLKRELEKAEAAAQAANEWLQYIRDLATAAALAGEQFPGYCLVPGSLSPRKWQAGTDKRIVRFQFADSIMPPTLVTPTKAEKILTVESWAKVARFVAPQERGKPYLRKIGGKQ